MAAAWLEAAMPGAMPCHVSSSTRLEVIHDSWDPYEAEHVPHRNAQGAANHHAQTPQWRGVLRYVAAALMLQCEYAGKGQRQAARA